MSIQPGTCLDVALGSYKPVVGAFNKVKDDAKTYAPVVALLPQMGAAISSAVYGTVQYGADRGNAAEIASAVSATTAFLYAQGQAAITAIANAAKNPVVGVGAFDLAAAWGVGKEAVAAYNGTCH